MMRSYFVDGRNRFRTSWTRERDALLVKLWSEDWSAAQIADKIEKACPRLRSGISRCAVIGRAHRLKLPARRGREAQRVKRRPTARARKVGAPAPRPLSAPQVEPLAPPRMRALTLLELEPRQCRYPIGPWYERARLFCAADASGIYCEYHQRIARVGNGVHAD